MNIKLKRFMEMPLLYKNWIKVMGNRFGLNHLDKVILRNNIRFNLVKGDSILNQSRSRAVISNIFGRYGYDVFREVKKGDVVIDIGAFIGDFSIKTAKQGAIVYAYEPSKNSFKLLKENIILNNCDNIFPFNLGISDKKKKAIMHKREWEGLNSLIDVDALNNKSRKKGCEEISMISMKDVFESNKIEHCDFLKIDCNGVEAEIVFGIEKDFFKKIKYIAMESSDYLHTGKNKKLISYLKENGFELKILTRTFEEVDNHDKSIMIFASNRWVGWEELSVFCLP